MWKSPVPKTPRKLGRELLVVTLVLVLAWPFLGGAFSDMVAYVVIYLALGVLRALNIKTVDLPNRAAVAEAISRRKRRRAA